MKNTFTFSGTKTGSGRSARARGMPVSFFNLKKGLSTEEVLKVMGAAFAEVGDSLVYNLEDRGYPLRLRLFFADGFLNDFYCYRGDL